MDDFWKFLTVIVACFGAYMAYQQFRLSREKFKLDLFEKRFSVFAGVRLFLSEVMRDGKTDLKAIFEYRASIAEASFLFEADVIDHLEEIYKRAVRMNTLDMKLKEVPVGEERNKLVAQEGEELTWLTDQLPVLKVKFERYLKFHVWH